MIKYLIQNPKKWNGLKLHQVIHSFGTTYDKSIFNYLENPTSENGFLRTLNPTEREIYHNLELSYYNDDVQCLDDAYLFTESLMRLEAKAMIQKALLDFDSNDIFDVLDSIKKEAESILQKAAIEHVNHYNEFKTELQKRINGEFKIIQSNILKEIPFLGGEITVIGARTGMGKTALALSIVLELCRDYKICTISAEMSVKRLLSRLASYELNISAKRINTGKVTEHEKQLIFDKIDEFENLDTLEMHYAKDIRKIKRIINNSDCELFIIDYLQLLSSDEKDDYKRIGSISQDLKALAVIKDIPIVELAQLSRESTKADDKRPTLTSLAKSGQIEQDANNIVFIHRPSYYYSKDIKNTLSDEDLEETELIIAKQRDGELKTDNIRFVKGKFLPLSDPNQKDNDYFNDLSITPNRDIDEDFDLF